MGIIYKIKSPNNRLYVGKTYNLKHRIASHKSSAKKDSNIILRNSIRKYGWDAHVLEVIEECADELMNEREIFWIAELKTYCYDYPGQMNMTKGGDGQRTTWKHDIERVSKLSEKMTGDGNPFFGRKHSEEFKKWMSEFSKERNKKNGTMVPDWGVEKGRLEVIQQVLCYNRVGEFVQKFDSYTEAAKFIGVKYPSRIYESVSGRKSQCNGWHFRKVVENFQLTIDVTMVKNKTVKRPIYWLSEDLEVICEFPSAQEASDFFSIPKTTINRAAQYNDLNPIRTGHIFCYKDEYLEEYSLVA